MLATIDEKINVAWVIVYGNLWIRVLGLIVRITVAGFLLLAIGELRVQINPVVVIISYKYEEFICIKLRQIKKPGSKSTGLG